MKSQSQLKWVFATSASCLFAMAVFASASTAAAKGPRVSVCGGSSGLQCAKGEYCSYATAALCGAADTGTCKLAPAGCSDEWDPVCGCDGNTYGNDCEAARAGVSVASMGECGQEYCSSNAECGKGQFCNELACGLFGDPGTCEDVPAGCPDEWDPVCGCDGQTHGNSCEAAMVGVGVMYNGPC